MKAAHPHLPRDYDITVKIRNNWMLQRMRTAGASNAAELSRLCGVGQSSIGALLGLKIPFLKKNGDWRDSVLRIADALKCLPEDLAPPQHREDALAKNTASFEASLEDVDRLLAAASEHEPLALVQQAETKTAINDVLRLRLSERERVAVEMRFGLNGEDESTFDQIGKRLCVQRERASQIFERGLRRMRSGGKARICNEDTSTFDAGRKAVIRLHELAT